MIHELKTDPAVYESVDTGAKTFEIRLNDRDFKVGDQMNLRETKYSGAQIKDGLPLEYTGRHCFKTVTHILTGYGLMPGWCCLSFRAPSTPAAEVDCPHCFAKAGEPCLWPETRETNRDHPHKAREALAATQAQASDTDRLEWLMHRLPGKALRDIGVITSSGGLHWARIAIDAAMGAPATPAPSSADHVADANKMVLSDAEIEKEAGNRVGGMSYKVGFIEGANFARGRRE